MTSSKAVAKREDKAPALPEEQSPLVRLAVEKGLDIESIQALVQMHREEQDRQAKREWHAAMAAFKRDCPPVQRRTENDQFKVTVNGVRRNRKYASLEDIEATVREPLANNGLSYRWGDFTEKDGKMHMDCLVSHVGGHTESSAGSVPVESKAGCSDQQKRGIAVAYVQRYTVIAALGLTSCEEDTDGNESGGSSDVVSEEQASTLYALIDEVGQNTDKFLAVYGVARIEDLPAANYKAAVELLERKR